MESVRTIPGSEAGEPPGDELDLAAMFNALDDQSESRAEAWRQLSLRAAEIQIVDLDSPYTAGTKQIAVALGATGFALNRWWVLTPPHWECPACGRSKAEFARLREDGALFGDIHEHHDHVADLVQKRFTEAAVSRIHPDLSARALAFAKRLAPMVSAYEPTLICADCNAADAEAKRMVGAPSDFSFAPSDIREFVERRPNRVHQIDRVKAGALWDRLRATFDLRLQLLDQLIQIALNDAHWFQPSPPRARPGQVESVAKVRISLFSSRLEASGWPNSMLRLDNYAQLMSAVRVNGRTPQTWRKHLVRALGRPATSADADLLAITHGGQWVLVPADWSCPCCGRAKMEIIQPSKHSPIAFALGSRNGMLDGPDKAFVCNECDWAIIGVAKESGVNFRRLSFQDILDCVIARPNRSHEVRPVEVVDGVIARIRDRQ